MGIVASTELPQRIDVGDLLVRRWADPGDLLPRLEAVNASFDLIHPWMEWLAEPATVESQRTFGDAAAVSWPAADGSCNYGIFDAEGAVLGGIGVHARSTAQVREIGYWCHAAHTGRGIITRCAAALTDLALALPGVEQVEIRCDEANVRSAAIPRRLGYRLARTEPRAIEAPAESGITQVWVRER